MPIKYVWLASACLAGLATATGAQSQSRAESAAANDDTGNEIIVTASKRDERLIDVPATITALGSDRIETQGIRDFRDYATLVPGLSQRDLGAPGLGTIILRGMNTGPQQTTNTAAFYIDDAPFSASGFLSIGSLVTPSPDLADIERIEVLKGPQGTLYGASSLGGLVRVVTKKADPSRFSGMAQVEGESVSQGGNGWAARAAVNIPLVSDRVAVRVSGFYRKAAGWIDNVLTRENDINSSTIKGGRIAFHATPTDRLTLDLTGLYQDIDNDGGSQQQNATGTTQPLYGRYKIGAVAGTGGSALRYRLATGTLNYRTEAGAIVAVASYIDSKSQFISDYTPNYGGYLSLAGIVPAGTQVVGTFGPNLKKFSAETRFVSKRWGPIEFVAGAFYTHENSDYPFRLVARNSAGTVLPAPRDQLYVAITGSKYQEYAAFGNLTVYLTNQLDVTGGIRYAHNNQSSSRPAGTLFYAPLAADSNRFSDDATTYLATLRYRPSSRISFYARAASGYRPGGPQTSTPLLPPNAQTSIKSDNVWNYEAGMKATALGGALSANLAVYHVDWKNIQLNTVYGGVTLLGNAGSAKIDGFELELQARPSRTLTFGATLGRTNARISDIDAVAAGSLGAKPGDKLPLTPGWTAATYVDQTIPLSEKLTATLGATLRYQSDMPSSYPGYALNRNVVIPSISTVDLRAGLEIRGYSLQLRAENIFNTLGYTSLTTSALYVGQPVPSSATTIRPRTLMLSATAKF